MSFSCNVLSSQKISPIFILQAFTVNAADEPCIKINCILSSVILTSLNSKYAVKNKKLVSKSINNACSLESPYSRLYTNHFNNVVPPVTLTFDA